jgi:peptidoglycan/xylan/chitin deacetylase (PgdA/CDA1 family)/GT2 family glycosyltransferase
VIKLSVVIPTRNRKHLLQRSVPSLLGQEFPPEQCEILIVLDSSSDGSEEYLRDCQSTFPLRIMHSARRGPSAARNVGIQAAQGELVLFLDDDLICPPDLFRLHCKAHAAAEPRVVHGPIYVAPGSAPTIVRYVSELFYENHYRPFDPAMELRYPADLNGRVLILSSMANSSMPREALQRCGGFDEEIFAAEDLELGLRLWKMGLVFRFLPGAAVHEHYIKSSWEFMRWQERTLAAGELRTSRKHPEYRPCSMLASFAESRAPRRWLRDVLMRSPISPVPLLSLPLRMEESFYSLPALRSAAVCVFRIAEKTARLRSSLRTAGSWRALQGEFGRTLPVLCYHHVGPLRDGVPAYLTVPPANFERQIRWLARHGYTAVTCADWLRWRREGRDLPAKPVLITFDDAYQETADFAFPILRRYGFTAVMYVVTGCIGGTNTWDEARGIASLPMMSAAEIRRWDAEGIEFGAHSRTHPNLTALTAAECLDEIRGSREDLAALLGKPVVSFAYPYGKHNAAVHEMARGEFDMACSVVEGINFLRTDLHLLRRAYVGPYDNMLEFAYIVCHGGLGIFRKLRGRLGVRKRLRELANLILRQKAGNSRRTG